MMKVFWGCSNDWVPKSKALYPDVEKIVDINFDKFDTFCGLHVISPDQIIQDVIGGHVQIVITTGSFESVFEQLYSWNLKLGVNFVVSHAMRDFTSVERLNKKKFNLIFSSSDYPVSNLQRGSRLGGGLYTCQIGPDGHFDFCKMVEGSFRQIALMKNGNIASIEYVNSKILIFDQSFNLLHEKSVDIPHMTGIASDDNDNLFVLSTGLDTIHLFDTNLNCISKYEMPWLGRNRDFGCHHINDCHYHEGELFFTFFSKSGSWRRGIFDGGVASLDIKHERITILTADYIQPHSPKIYDGELYFCESPRGTLWKGSANKVFNINGFLRGLAKVEDITIVGQSDTLYFSKFKRESLIWMGAGFHVVDETNNIAEFHKVPGLKNIHDFILRPTND